MSPDRFSIYDRSETADSSRGATLLQLLGYLFTDPACFDCRSDVRGGRLLEVILALQHVKHWRQPNIQIRQAIARVSHQPNPCRQTKNRHSTKVLVPQNCRLVLKTTGSVVWQTGAVPVNGAGWKLLVACYNRGCRNHA